MPEPLTQSRFSRTLSIAIIFFGFAINNGSADLIDSFAPGPVSRTTMGAYVHAIGVQPDGKILIGGQFTRVGGGLVGGNLARLDKETGSLDSTFTGYTGGTVHSIQVQSDGRILIAGTFVNASGVSQYALARLNPDGSHDSTFSVAVNGIAYAVIIDSNGQIILGGKFNYVNSVPCNNIVKLDTTGNVVSAYGAGVGVNSSAVIYTMAIQPDGKLLVGGFFSSAQGVSRSNLARFNTDNSLDTGFTVGTNNDVETIVVDTNGNVVFGGFFTEAGGVPRNYLARCRSDGSLDGSFAPNPSYRIYSLASQSDGKLLIGGSFTTISGVRQNYLARVHINGNLDTTFNANLTSGAVEVMRTQPDGRILVAGGFETFDGKPRYGMARLYSKSALDPSGNQVSYATKIRQIAKYKAQLRKAQKARKWTLVKKMKKKIRIALASLR